MYANLRVKAGNAAGDSPVLNAWKVELDAEKVTVHLDANDGSGNYAEEAGEMVIDRMAEGGHITIEADF